MLRIRLSRTGKKKQASYRVVVADVESPRDGRIVERIGHYNPLADPSEYHIKEDRALHWLSVGAQPSDAVRRLLEKQGTLTRLDRLHAGESLEALVAEYKGEPLETAVAETPSVVAQATGFVADVVEDVQEAIGAAVEEIAEALGFDEEE